MNANKNSVGARARFSRQLALTQIGEAGQQRLGAANALLIGCGALGCALAETLARAGVGALTILDRDIVDESNLHRQTLFSTSDARDALPKAVAAQRRLRDIAPGTQVEALVTDLTPDRARAIAKTRFAFDVILDATDNFETRYLLNDLAVASSAPLVYAGVVQTHGVVMPILPTTPRPRPPTAQLHDQAAPAQDATNTPCLRCIFPDAPPPGSTPTCETAGVLPSAVQVIAGLQATEAFRIVLQDPSMHAPALTSVDVWTGAFTRIRVERDPACPCCCDRRFVYLDAHATQRVTTLCGRNSVQITPSNCASDARSIDLRKLADRLAPLGAFRVNEYALRGALLNETGDQNTPVEITVFADGRTIVSGVADPTRARAIHARCIGA